MKIYGRHDERTVQQLTRCVAAEKGALGVLCADGHVGYSMPIGGVVAYRQYVSPSGVGYDIACGNLAVQTNLRAADIAQAEMVRVADEIQRRISFGVGRRNHEPIDDPVFDVIAHSPVPAQRRMLQLAQHQLGTVGGGNHYVDILEDQQGAIWVACHFGSRGFGHKTASGFMNVARGRAFEDGRGEGSMDAPPLLLDAEQPSGQDYIAAMTIAGQYAYAGRGAVVARVLEILGAEERFSVHNHHNFAWRESHGSATYWVVRKGATPAFPGQWGFVGGSMGDMSVVLRGVEGAEAKAALYSTVHGAGRVMSRRHAKGAVNFNAVRADIRQRGIILRGAAADEAPQVYRPLGSVLEAHAATIEIVHTLTPRIVVMAGGGEHDPYRD
jgi:tRNA-splicing ligase RtcB